MRGVRSSLAAVLVLSGAASLALMTPESAAASATGPALTLLDQSAYVMPPLPGGPARFHIEVGIGAGVPSDAQLVVTVYKHLQTRSSFERTLADPPQGVLQTLDAVAPSSLPVGPTGGRRLNLAVVPQRSSTAGVQSPTIDLNCASLSASCSGVYPVVVALERPQAGILGHFTTYLTYTQGNADPLLFAWVVPFAAPLHFSAKTGPLTQAILPPSPATLSNLAQLAGLLREIPQVSVTVEAAPETLQLLERTAAGRQVVDTLSKLSLTPTTHQFLRQPYVPIDLNALAAAGLTQEIVDQLAAGSAATPPTIHTEPPVNQGGATWVAAGSVGTALERGLRLARATRVVVPDADLGGGSDRATWSQPFELPLAKGKSVLAGASDGELAAHFSAGASDPVLAANQLLADLSVIHLVEEPFPADPRGVIAVPPPGWVPNPTFVATILKGLNGNPVVQATTLDGFFSRVPKGGNQSPTTRHLQTPGPGPSLGAAQTAAVVHTRGRVEAFAGAVVGRSTVKSQLDDLLLTTESDELNATGQRDALGAFEHQLTGQLSLVQVASRTITITARSASIPITITSSAPYSLRGTLSLSSGKLEFPRGNTRTVSIDHPTNSTRVEVRALTSGDLPLELTLTSPDGRLVLARGRLTVRSTATSVVGIALTALAVLVLAVWWARTWRKRRRDQRGRPPRGLGAHASP